MAGRAANGVHLFKLYVGAGTPTSNLFLGGDLFDWRSKSFCGERQPLLVKRVTMTNSSPHRLAVPAQGDYRMVR